MAISIQEYRSRIGRYLPKTKCRKYSLDDIKVDEDFKKKNVPTRVCFFVICSLIFSLTPFTNLSTSETRTKDFNLTCAIRAGKSTNPIMINQPSVYIKLGNFYARYTNGNRQARGIKIAHFNKGPGHLSTKVNEIENAISGFHPHIFGISEANLFKHHDLQDVQIPDYNLHTCPTLSNPDLGYSRIVVYTHKSIVCKLRPDLMDDSYSSIWMQVGLPRHKQILVCQTYREWQLLHQADTSSKNIGPQLDRSVMFLNQWERALLSGMEVVVCGY